MKACSIRPPRPSRLLRHRARAEAQPNRAAPGRLFTTVDYDRSLIPGVIVMSLFMGSLMSGVFNWVMDTFMGVTECYLVTPLSRWDIAGGILASGVTITSIAAASWCCSSDC